MEQYNGKSSYDLSLSASSKSPKHNQSPCAACKVLRRRCLQNCALAPFFPPDNPLKFTIAHRVFGACNITKLLQEIPEHLRADAVNSLVYEANARIRDPVYGCTGIIFHLQNQITELEEELAKVRAGKTISNMESQHYSVASSFAKEMASEHPFINSLQQHPWNYTNTSFSGGEGSIPMSLRNLFGLE